MTNKRKSFGQNLNIILFNQVDGVCPFCSKPLVYEKKGAKFKSYELAHIYPLNPTPQEVVLLKNEERLSQDVDHEDNIIPICKECHDKFDNPRTVEEYQQLVSLKKQLLGKSEQKGLWHQYQIEQDILKIIDALLKQDFNADSSNGLTFEPKEVDRKLSGSISNLTIRKIKNNVTQYFPFIKKKFAAIEAENPGSSDLISIQIKHYYLKQKQNGLQQHEIYVNIVKWINVKTKSVSEEASDVIASFFVQNCEVFE